MLDDSGNPVGNLPEVISLAPREEVASLDPHNDGKEEGSDAAPGEDRNANTDNGDRTADSDTSPTGNKPTEPTLPDSDAEVPSDERRSGNDPTSSPGSGNETNVSVIR